jgi:hypothetical protein
VWHNPLALRPASKTKRLAIAQLFDIQGIQAVALLECDDQKNEFSSVF